MSGRWKTIRLELTKTPDFPSGSASRAYLLRLPLEGGGEVDQAALLHSPHSGTFRRHWASDPDEAGRVFLSGKDCVLRSDDKPDRILKLVEGSLLQGRLASLVDNGGTILPLQVVSIN